MTTISKRHYARPSRRGNGSPHRALPLYLQRHADGQIWVQQNCGATAVRLNRCFPWSEKEAFISLRDAENDEVAMIPHLDQLDPDSRAVAESALRETGFVFTILAIEFIAEDFEIYNWKVRTEEGARTFQTEHAFRLIRTPNGEILVEDVANDLYRVPDVEVLDSASQQLLWPHLG